MRTLLITVVALAAACSPPTRQTAETHETSTAPAADATTAALIAALAPVIAQDIGQRVSLQVANTTVRDEWAFITVQPRKPDGSAIDWSTTPYAQRAADGVLDGDGTTYALLKHENGSWMVLEHVIGPTDVAWIEWAAEHGVPADILGLPSN